MATEAGERMKLLEQFLAVVFFVGFLLTCAGIVEKLFSRRVKVLPPPDKATVRNTTECVP